MAQKGIREADGKQMIARLLPEYTAGKYTLENKFISVSSDTDLEALPQQHAWLLEEKLVVKPDQLIKRRGKSNLLLLNAGWQEAKNWIEERRGRAITVGNVSGVIDNFIIEPFIPHQQEDEYYLAIISLREGDEILFHHQGGVDVGDIDAKALRLFVPIGEYPAAAEISDKLLVNVSDREKQALIAGFIEGMFKFYAELNYAYLEINPFIVTAEGKIYPLDLAAKLDDTAEFESGRKWGRITFPSPFGRRLSAKEAFIAELDAKTGASLKLTVLNEKGRLWTMVAGGGASVIYADTITDLGYMQEMANYGEYSGDPSESFTYLYAKTILALMTAEKHPSGKVLIIGGGIANFTDVASTFKGIVRAIREFQDILREHKIKILVRRGGPNYKEGLKNMEKLGEEINIPIEVYGPETHMTRVVPMAIRALQGGE